MPFRLGCFLIVLFFLFGRAESFAVLFHATADPAHNTTAPEGELAGSGWQLQGRWGDFLGTPVAPRYFITARHVGGSVGDKLSLNGREFTTIARFDHPNSDLRLWQTCETFSEYAELYTGSLEANQSVVVFGRGTRRGEEVRISTPLAGELKGWRWGAADKTLRWGENRVAAIVPGDGVQPTFGGAIQVGDLLQCRFKADGGANEAHLSTGDSGGGLFLKDGGVWKLAGINYAVDGPYNTSNSGPGFSAAIFDEGGLFKGGPGNWSPVLNLPVDLPGSFYATRISSNLAWIQSILNAPLPPGPPPVLQSSSNPSGPYTDPADATTDSQTQTISIPLTGNAQFFRLRGCDSAVIRFIRLEDEMIVVGYE